MKDKACKKRFDILLQFWNELKDDSKVTDVDFIRKFIRNEINPIPADNRRIKEALKATSMFDQITEIPDKETGEYLRKYEAVTMHKGRDTFISNLVDKTPLNELMKYTAHTKLSTLQGYIDRNRPVSMDYITSTFNRR